MPPTLRHACRLRVLGAVLIAIAAVACASSPPTTSPPVIDSGMKDSAVADATHKDASKDSAPVDAGPPLCSSLPGTKIYIESGDTQEQILDTLGRELRDNTDITIVFLLTGSCTITPEVYDGTPIPKNTDMLYMPSTKEDPTWATGDPEYNCVTDPDKTTPIDIGIAALFPSSCVPGAPPKGIGTFVGPIQAYTFIVPSAEFDDGQTSISAEEAYYAIGDGANNPVTWKGSHEWNVPSQFYLRPSTKSTLVSTALNIGLTPQEATLTDSDGGATGSDGRQLEGSSSDVVTAVAAATSKQAIGILGAEVYDSSKDRNHGINVLAFAGFGQKTRYFPDSTITSFDKENVRNGNYSLWSPAVLMTAVNGSDVPTNATVKYFIDLFLGTPGAAPPGGYVDGGAPIDGLAATVGAGLTPDCAMQVQRTADGAPLKAYTPAAPCTCYFLKNVPNAAPLPASCVTCSANKKCEKGSCFNGYCEVTPPPSVTATEETKTDLVLPASDSGADAGLLPLNP